MLYPPCTSSLTRQLEYVTSEAFSDFICVHFCRHEGVHIGIARLTSELSALVLGRRVKQDPKNDAQTSAYFYGNQILYDRMSGKQSQ